MSLAIVDFLTRMVLLAVLVAMMYGGYILYTKYKESTKEKNEALTPSSNVSVNSPSTKSSSFEKER